MRSSFTELADPFGEVPGLTFGEPPGLPFGEPIGLMAGEPGAATLSFGPRELWHGAGWADTSAAGFGCRYAKTPGFGKRVIAGVGGGAGTPDEASMPSGMRNIDQRWPPTNSFTLTGVGCFGKHRNALLDTTPSRTAGGKGPCWSPAYVASASGRPPLLPGPHLATLPSRLH